MWCKTRRSARAIIEALIFVSEEPLSAKIIADVLREDREVVDAALAELSKEFNGRNGGLQLARGCRWLAVCDAAGVSRARARLFEIEAQRQAFNRFAGDAGGHRLQTAGHRAGDSRDTRSAIALFDQDPARQKTDRRQGTQRNCRTAHDVRNVERLPDAVWLEGSWRAAEHGRLSGSCGRRVRQREKYDEIFIII